MIAIPARPRIWTPSPRLPVSASPRRPIGLLHAMGRLFTNSGWNFNAAGGSFGSATGKPCCVYQARDCATNTLQSLYVKKSQFPSYPSTYFFELSGTCYYVQSTDKVACSNTPNVSGETAFSSCAACTSGGGGAPCSCAWPAGLSATYTVAGTGSIGTCPLCDSDTTDPAWDGSFHHVGGGCVWWAADASFDPLSINGAMLDITYTQIVLNAAACRWEMYIACGSVINPTQTMWWGTKTTGSTPAGNFSFQGSDCGNTAPATLPVS